MVSHCGVPVEVGSGVCVDVLVGNVLVPEVPGVDDDVAMASVLVVTMAGVLPNGVDGEPEGELNELLTALLVAPLGTVELPMLADMLVIVVEKLVNLVTEIVVEELVTDDVLEAEGAVNEAVDSNVLDLDTLAEVLEAADVVEVCVGMIWYRLIRFAPPQV